MKIILDTDIDTDCDDAGALAVLHHYHKQNLAEILGIICSIPLADCVQCTYAINEWYGHSDIPIGVIALPIWEAKPSWLKYLDHRQFISRKGCLYNAQIKAKTLAQPTDAVQLYRRLLVNQPDNSVTICAIGTLTAIAALLDSASDDISPLSGQELVAQKVEKLVSMAVAGYPHGCDGFNWRMDIKAAQNVLANWPTVLVNQGLGCEVFSGRQFIVAPSDDNPVQAIYRIWLRGWGEENRPSPDQLTVIYSVEGAGDLFVEKGNLQIAIDDDGVNTWSESTGGPERVLLEAAVDAKALAVKVEGLMLASLR